MGPIERQERTDVLATALLVIAHVDKWTLLRMLAAAFGVEWAAVQKRAHEVGGRWVEGKVEP